MEYKFRGLGLYSKKWVYGNLIHMDDADEDYRDIIIPIEDNCTYVDNDDGYGAEDWHKVDSNTVGLYTGAKDTNKKEIYKGDICKDDTGTIVEIVWIEDKYQFGAKVLEGCTLSKGLTFPLWQWNGCKENGYRRLERIGNIYENKDMINKEG